MPTGWEPGRAGKPQQWVCHATSYQACGPSKGQRSLPSPPQLPGCTSVTGPGLLEGWDGKVCSADLWDPEELWEGKPFLPTPSSSSAP